MTRERTNLNWEIVQLGNWEIEELPSTLRDLFIRNAFYSNKIADLNWKCSISKFPNFRIIGIRQLSHQISKFLR